VSRTARVGIVGAGLAGLVAALEAARAGAQVVVFERDDEPGGATAASAGWIWRYGDLRLARTFAPAGDPELQRRIVESLDGDLAWLVEQGAVLRRTSTGRRFTVGVQVDPRQVLDVLQRRIEHLQPRTLQVGATVIGARRGPDGCIELAVRHGRGAALGDQPVEQVAVDAVVFAGGGYARDLERIAIEAAAGPDVRDAWVLRAEQGGDGSSMDAAMQLDALRRPADGECLVRLVPHVDGHPDARWLVQAGELQVPGHRLFDPGDGPIVAAEHDWSGAQAAWQLARRSGHGFLELPTEALREHLHSGRRVEDVVREAIAAGAAGGRRAGGGVWLAVRAGITVTRCTLRVDADARLLQVARGSRGDGGRLAVVAGAWAAGADAACTGLGGTASGLAHALVLGRRAGAAAAG
jgi:hypothetical protein